MKRAIRKPHKRPDDSSKLVLREIIGLTTIDSNGLASSDLSSNCVYIAGCTVVVYDVESCRQSHLLVSHRNPRPLSCVTVSGDGRFVAAGESGTQPAVLVWEIASMTFISELKSHLYGVKCIAFSPDGTHLVSVGGYIHLWEWRSSTLRTKLKASSSCSAISSVCFSLDGKFVVTSGKKHLKFWVVGQSTKPWSNKGVKSLTMHGKTVDLRQLKERTFVSILSTSSCGQIFYTLTEAGVLSVIHSDLSVRKSMDLEVEKGFALSVSENLLASACSNGIVRLVTTETLKLSGTLLYTRDRTVSGKNGLVSVAKDVEIDYQLLDSLPDAVACQFTKCKKLVVVYGDRSLYIWNIQNINSPTRFCVLFSHSSCIWDIKNLCCDNLHDQSLACVARGCTGGMSFATCSSDGSIRLWDLLFQSDAEVSENNHSLKSKSTRNTSLVSTATFERDSMELGFSTQGFRTMAVSPDGKYLAAGDSKGSVHIYDLKNFDYTCLQDAHDSEILSLSFGLTRKKCVDSNEKKSTHYFLASGGCDQLINLYDATRNFDLVETIDDHSAAVTSVKLGSDCCKILSSSADRSLVFRDASFTNDAFHISHRLHQTASQGTVYDMTVDSKMEIAVTVGQDNKISTFDIASGKLIRLFKQNKEFGDPIKVAMDPSCTYLVCLYSNKSLSMYDFITGELVTQAMGHGEIITGVIFLPDLQHIISVGGDGCIFVWKLPALLSSTMQQRIKETFGPVSPKSLVQPATFSQIIPSEEQICAYDGRDRCLVEDIDSVGPKNDQQVGDIQERLEFKLSVSRLPRWAQDKVTSFSVIPGELDLASLQEVESQHTSPLGSDVQGYACCSTETQIPCEHDMGINEASHSSLSTSSPHSIGNCASTTPQGSSFAMDKRWNCIYTVCFTNTPEMQSVKDKIQGRPEFQSNDQIEFGLESQIRDAYVLESKSMSERNVLCDSSNVNECHHYRETVSDNALDVLEPMDLSRSLQEFQEPRDDFHTNSEESDLFKKHFGSLSSMQKIERGNPTKRRRLSARFTCQRDYTEGFKRLFDSPSKSHIGNIGTTNDEPSLQVQDEQHTKDYHKQDPKNFIQPTEARERKQVGLEESEMKRKIILCREALLALDVAADNAANLFSELQNLGFREALLCAEATKLIPSVLDKLNGLAKLVQAQSCSNKACL